MYEDKNDFLIFLLTRLTPEEQLSRYNRIIATSLNAYAAFWQELDEKQPCHGNHSKDVTREENSGSKFESWKQLRKVLEKTKEIQESILNEGKFWKYSQSKESMV